MNITQTTDNNGIDFINITIIAGESVSIVQTITDGSGTPINLTGYKFKSQIDFEIPLLLTTENGGFVVGNPANGQVTFNITSAQTENETQGGNCFDVWMIYPLGEQVPIYKGCLLIMDNITP